MNKLKERFVKLAPENRLYHFDRPIIALTGGIATGKSTVTKLLTSKGFEIIDADQLVKNIYALQESKDFVKARFPEAWNEEIDFKILRELVFKNAAAKTDVEQFIYARLPEAFMNEAKKIKEQEFYIYDVPLLYERGLDKKVDLSVVIYAPRKTQLARIIDRDGSKEETANKILEHQMDIEEKKEKADFVIDNSGTVVELAAEVDQLLLQILQ